MDKMVNDKQNYLSAASKRYSIVDADLEKRNMLDVSWRCIESFDVRKKFIQEVKHPYFILMFQELNQKIKKR